MEGFGHGILKALVTDIDPDAKVKEMNLVHVFDLRRESTRLFRGLERSAIDMEQKNLRTHVRTLITLPVTDAPIISCYQAIPIIGTS